MKAEMKPVLVITDERGNEDAIHMTQDDYEQFAHAASACDEPMPEMSPMQVVDFLCKNTHIYYRGKMWGFNDTEVREEICAELEKNA